jgi:hypothetical protein
MIWVILFFILVIGIPLAKATGLLKITWGQAVTPLYLILVGWLAMVALFAVIILIGVSL